MFTYPGQGCHFKDLGQRSADLPSLMQGWGEIREVSTIPGFTTGFILMNYIEPKKITSIPLSRTAFRRATTINLAIMLWNDNTRKREYYSTLC